MKKVIEAENGDIVVTLTKHLKPIVCIEMGSEEYAFLSDEKVDQLIYALQLAKSISNETK